MANANTEEQNDSSTNASKQFFERFLKSYLLTGPAENVLANLACVNTVYLVFVFWFVLITSLFYAPLIRNKIEHEMNVCKENPSYNWTSDCESVESITNRIGFTLAIIFIALAVVSIFTPPDRVHQGFWLVKFLLVFILLPASFMIPVGRFDQTWSIVCFVGSLVFYCIETVLVLDFATAASDIFVVKITEERSRSWYLAWLLLVWLIYVLAVVSVLLLYGFYADDCGLSAMLVTILFIFCALYTLLAVYFSERRVGFLHSGLCTLFLIFLTLVTLNHEGFCQDEITTADLQGLSKAPDEVIKYLEIFLGFLLVAYGVLRNYNEKYHSVKGLTVSRNFVAGGNNGSVEEESLNSQNEMKTPVFNTSAFFAVFGIFALFATSKLTALRTTKYSEPTISDSTTFHVRCFTVLLILLSIIWSQICPALYPNENPFDMWVLGKTFFKFQWKICRRVLIDGSGCCNGPVASRYIFTALYISGVLFSCLLYIPEVRHSLNKNTYFCTTISTRGICLSTDPAYMAVYRVCFAMATFYLLFAVILLCVGNTRDTRANGTRDTNVDSAQEPRVELQHKAWPVKICFFCSLLLASFLLPNEFNRVWIYIALIGTFLFTLLQLTLLIYWTKTTSTNLQERIESSESQIWPTLLIIATIFMILLSLAAIVTFYVFFSKFPRCMANIIFITLNVVLIVITSLVSVHPNIYNAGLFHCYAIVIFSLYLTWSGLSHNPDEECNPVAGYIAEVDMRPNLNIQAGLDLFFTFVTVIYFSSKAPKISENIRSAYDNLRGVYDSSRKEESSVTVIELESQSEMYCPNYNFSLFHGAHFLASLHASIILTNWFIPTPGSHFKLSVNWAAMCVKMTASNLSFVIYVWIIAAQFLNRSKNWYLKFWYFWNLK